MSMKRARQDHGDDADGHTFAWGIKLSHLVYLGQSHGEKNIKQLCDTFIKPTTATFNSSYAEFLLASPETQHLVKSVADVFMSYPWSLKLEDLISALTNGNTDDDDNALDRFLWIDVFVLNQHGDPADHNNQAWFSMFADTLQTIGNAEFILTPWHKPVISQRIWCIYEHALTENLTQVRFRTTPTDEQDFKDKLKSGVVGVRYFTDIIAGLNVDVEHAGASREIDRSTILQLVHKLGISHVNGALLDAVKQWMIHTAVHVAGTKTAEESKERGDVLNAVACLHEAVGNVSEALVWHSKSLQVRRNVFGPSHEATAVALNNIAACLCELERYEEALEMHEQALSIDVEVYGAKHAHVGQSYSNIVACMQRLGRIEEALEANGLALTILEDVYGRTHPDVAAALSNNGSCLEELGKTEEALIFYNEALIIDEKVYGHNHPEVALDLNNKATCLDQIMGCQDEAKRVGRMAVEIAECTLGPTHPVTLQYQADWGV